VVTEIIGRSNDYLLSLSKKKVSSLFMSLVSEDFNNSIKNMQFHQYKVDEVEVWLEVDDNYKPIMNQIIVDKLHYSLGEKMNVIVKVVDEIPKDKSGKFRYIVNKLMEGN
jgi:phenylacetate-CoA ligase